MTSENKAQIVIEKLGGNKPFIASELNLDRGTVWKWCRTGVIPAKHHKNLIILAEKMGAELSYQDMIVS